MSDIYRSAKYDQEMNRLRARIAELEACASTSVCIFCGATMEKDLAVMLDHAKGCELRPENRLMLQIAELEAENKRLKVGWDCAELAVFLKDGLKKQAEAENQTQIDNATFWREKSYKAEAALDSFLGLDGGKTVIELRAELAERDRMLRLLWEVEHFAEAATFEEWCEGLLSSASQLADPRTRAKRGSENG